MKKIAEKLKRISAVLMSGALAFTCAISAPQTALTSFAAPSNDWEFEISLTDDGTSDGLDDSNTNKKVVSHGTLKYTVEYKNSSTGTDADVEVTGHVDLGTGSKATFSEAAHDGTGITVDNTDKANGNFKFTSKNNASGTFTISINVNDEIDGKVIKPTLTLKHGGTDYSAVEGDMQATVISKARGELNIDHQNDSANTNGARAKYDVTVTLDDFGDVSTHGRHKIADGPDGVTSADLLANDKDTGMDDIILSISGKYTDTHQMEKDDYVNASGNAAAPVATNGNWTSTAFTWNDTTKAYETKLTFADAKKVLGSGNAFKVVYYVKNKSISGVSTYNGKIYATLKYHGTTPDITKDAEAGVHHRTTGYINNVVFFSKNVNGDFNNKKFVDVNGRAAKNAENNINGQGTAETVDNIVFGNNTGITFGARFRNDIKGTSDDYFINAVDTMLVFDPDIIKPENIVQTSDKKIQYYRTKNNDYGTTPTDYSTNKNQLISNSGTGTPSTNIFLYYVVKTDGKYANADAMRAARINDSNLRFYVNYDDAVTAAGSTGRIVGILQRVRDNTANITSAVGADNDIDTSTIYAISTIDVNDIGTIKDVGKETDIYVSSNFFGGHTHSDYTVPSIGSGGKYDSASAKYGGPDKNGDGKDDHEGYVAGTGISVDSGTFDNGDRLYIQDYTTALRKEYKKSTDADSAYNKTASYAYTDSLIVDVKTTASFDMKDTKHDDVDPASFKNPDGSVKKVEVTFTDEIKEKNDFTIVSGSLPTGATYNDSTGIITYTTTVDFNKGDVATLKYQLKPRAVTVGNDIPDRTTTPTIQIKDGKNASNTAVIRVHAGAETAPPQPKKDVLDKVGGVSINGKQMNVGDTLVYSITYKNPYNNARTVTITDVLPAELEYQSSSDSGSASGQTVTWTLNNVAAGYEGSVTVTTKIRPDAYNKTIINKAKVVVGSYDQETNEVKNPTPDKPAPVKKVTNSSNTDINGQTVSAGDVITYTIQVKNTTGGVANVAISDTVPEGTTFKEADQGGKLENGIVKWAFSNVGINESVTVTFKVTVNSNTTGGTKTINNTAAVKVGSHDMTTNTVTIKVPPTPTTTTTTPPTPTTTTTTTTTTTPVKPVDPNGVAGAARAAQTWDSSNVPLYTGLLFITVGAIAAVLMARKKLGER